MIDSLPLSFRSPYPRTGVHNGNGKSKVLRFIVMMMMMVIMMMVMMMMMVITSDDDESMRKQIDLAYQTCVHSPAILMADVSAIDSLKEGRTVWP